MKGLFEPVVIQRVQTVLSIPSPHTRVYEGYFSASLASGGLSVNAAKASSLSFSRMFKESLHVNIVHQHIYLMVYLLDILNR